MSNLLKVLTIAAFISVIGAGERVNAVSDTKCKSCNIEYNNCTEACKKAEITPNFPVALHLGVICPPVCDKEFNKCLENDPELPDGKMCTHEK